MDEEQLIADIKQNPALFGKVYDLHYSRLFNYCYRRTGDFDASKDIIAEAFLKAYLNINKFQWRGKSIKGWLYRIATNEINLHHRAKKYRPTLLTELGIETAEHVSHQFESEKAAAEIELAQHQQFTEIQKSLISLPVAYQEVISLKYFEELKIREISDILDKPEGTVKSLLSRGIQLLKQKI